MIQPELLLNSALTIILALVGYAMTRINKGFDKHGQLFERHADQFAKHGELIVKQTQAMGDLSTEIKIMNSKMERLERALQTMEMEWMAKRQELHEAIELVRSRIHDQASHIQGLMIRISLLEKREKDSS